MYRIYHMYLQNLEHKMKDDQIYGFVNCHKVVIMYILNATGNQFKFVLYLNITLYKFG